MFAGKLSIGKVCKINFGILQVVYNNYDKSYHELLNFSNNVSFHQRLLRLVATEVYKSLMIMNP